MKLYGSVIFVVVLCAGPCLAQKKEFREQTFAELLSLIEHPLELLGKTDSSIVTAGRPATIVGGDEWKAEVFDTSEKNSTEVSKTVLVGTGRGALMLMTSPKTRLVYTAIYIPHSRAKINGDDMLRFLQGKCSFNNEGMCVYQTESSGKIGIAVLNGALTLLALEEEGGKLRFK